VAEVNPSESVFVNLAVPVVVNTFREKDVIDPP